VGALLCCHEAIIMHFLTMSRGHISGILSARNNLAYSALKAGVLGLTRQMAVDFGIHGAN
jgi:NAD(P)-dependent dehydrogenase (short-subunit alcohol dehydrogenase family)